MKLTKTEKEILLHRLAVPDAIDDALTDCDEPKYSHELVDYGIGWIEQRVRDGLSFEGLTDVEKAVLEDCVDGSTWLGCAKGEVSEQRLGQMKYIGDKLADKVSLIIGRKVRFPNG